MLHAHISLLPADRSLFSSSCRILRMIFHIETKLERTLSDPVRQATRRKSFYPRPIAKIRVATPFPAAILVGYRGIFLSGPCAPPFSDRWPVTMIFLASPRRRERVKESRVKCVEEKRRRGPPDGSLLPVCVRVHGEVSSSNKRKVALRDLLLLPRTHPPPSACVPLPPLLRPLSLSRTRTTAAIVPSVQTVE